jgi:hypothetical protein
MEKVCCHLGVERDPVDNLLKYRRPVDVMAGTSPAMTNMSNYFAALP